MKPVKLSAGRYRIGNTVVVKIPAKTARENKGHRTIVTWQNEATGKWIGYSLKESVHMVEIKTQRGEL